ncbi:MAG: lycopene cyclase domain-containing protein [Flavobacteriales bacterium]
MTWLYLLLNLGSFSIPFLYSFEKNMRFIKHIKPLAVSTAITGLFFILWDVWFTKMGVWGFNPKYYLGQEVLALPIEEWLFFICIPYACIFTHCAIFYFNPSLKLKDKLSGFITVLLIILGLSLAFMNTDKIYTFINFIVFTLVLGFGYITNKSLLQKFYISFLVILIPFILVNGILTGSFIEEEVVWYNNAENLNLRLLTIPIEDMGYAFSLLFSNLLIFETLKKSTTLWPRKKILPKTKS